MNTIFKIGLGLLLSILNVIGVYSQSNNNSNQVEYIHLIGESVFPEGIVELPNNDLLVGGIGDGSIQRIDSKNKVTYFNKPHENGLFSTLGMCVDEKRNQLWVINLNQKTANGYPGSNLKIFDLATGKLIKTISENFIVGAFFNEIDIDGNGRVYISNTIGPEIYTATFNSTEAEVFVKNDLLTNPAPDQPLALNGLAITPDKKFLIVSVMSRFHGGDGRLVRINLTTKEVSPVLLTGDEATKAFAGSDHMFFYKGQLFMVNVFSKAATIMTAEFNKDYSTANLKIRDKSQTIYDRPAASAIRKGRIYTINSQLNHVVDDKDGKLNTPPVPPFTVVSVPLSELMK